jgi:hypothetical protein
MIKFAQINVETGEIVNIINLQSAHGYTDGSVQNGLLCKRLEPGTNEIEFPKINYWRNNQWNIREAQPDFHYLWKNDEWVLDIAPFWEGVRYKRDILLRGSDWSQLPDNKLDDVKKALWITYRQELRDITATYTDAVKESDIIWPSPP